VVCIFLNENFCLLVDAWIFSFLVCNILWEISLGFCRWFIFKGCVISAEGIVQDFVEPFATLYSTWLWNECTDRALSMGISGGEGEAWPPALVCKG